ncbi:MAG TPA: TPM domain-containing protein, partial [Candidatus Avimonas sp.]|nr:TPM domain-containing protein [Candidatus Avimonas sp.]
MVCVTVESLGGQDLEEFSIDLARDWRIGQEGKNYGILLLLAVSERQVRIEVGYGLEGAMTDIKSGIILDTYAIPYFKNDDFSTGLKKAYNAIVNEVYIEYGLEPEEGYIPADDIRNEDPAGDDDGEGIAGLLILIIAVFVISLLLSTRRNRRGGPPFIFFGG